MEYVADSLRNPFGMDPPCERPVPGYGDTRAHFHVVGDHPGVHGGLQTGVPFTGRPWSASFFDALSRGGLVEGVEPDGDVRIRRTFLSYLHMCDPGDSAPDANDYAALEPYFDAELRAVTAHVLLPVGERATRHVFETYTSRSRDAEVDLRELHATEVRGAGWLVLPVLEPAAWDGGDADALADALVALRESDYRQTSDLGRFRPDDEPYYVR